MEVPQKRENLRGEEGARHVRNLRRGKTGEGKVNTRPDGMNITCVDLVMDSVFYLKERGRGHEVTGHVIVDCDLIFGAKGCTWLWDEDDRQ